jgi:hypothetical protein
MSGRAERVHDGIARTSDEIRTCDAERHLPPIYDDGIFSTPLNSLISRAFESWHRACFGLLTVATPFPPVAFMTSAWRVGEGKSLIQIEEPVEGIRIAVSRFMTLA